MSALKKIILLLLFFCSLNYTNAQNIGRIKEKTLIFKVKDLYRDICFDDYIRNESLMKIFDRIQVSELNKIFPNHTKPLTKTDKFGNKLVDLSLIYRLKYKADFCENSVITLLDNTRVLEYVELEVMPELLFVPNDPGIPNQYYLNNIKAFQAWNLWKGDSSFVVGIVDTGYDIVHPDLVNALKYNVADPIDGLDNDNDGFIDNFYGWNFGNNNNNVQVVAHGHGVHVSGLAGATPNNTFGIAGVGYNTKLLPVKIDNEFGLLVRPFEGIVYAADRGAKVINCSWGSNLGAGKFGQDVVNYATFNKQALVVAAAGNSNSEVEFFPCAYSNVFCVAGTKANDFKWEESSFYRKVDISAPGHNIFSTWVNGTFTHSGGTSMSAPIVAGAAALIWSKFQNLHPLQIKEHIKNTSDLIDTVGTNNLYEGKLGKGRLNMFRALTDSFSSAIKLLNLTISDYNNEVFVINDTLYITGNFINYLKPTTNLLVNVTTTSTNVELVNTSFNAGHIAEMQTFNNQNNPFTLRLLPSMPSNYNLELKFIYTDSNYLSNDFYVLNLNIDYLDISANRINTTITSNGNFAYNNLTNLQQGTGYLFDGNTFSILSSAGLLIAYANNRVMDNLWNVTGNVDKDFVTIMPTTRIIPPLKGDENIINKFDDSGATNRIGLKVEQNTYAYNRTNHLNYVIVEYDIINTSQTNLQNFYAGIFADWELPLLISNRGSTAFQNKLGFVHNLDSSLYAGIQLLSNSNFIHYAIDNNGQSSSINLNDGFSSVEKFTTLTTTRLTSGTQPNGNNVSQVVSSGPFSLISYDTLKIAFAFHTAYSFNELINSASIAEFCYNNNCFASICEQNKQIQIFPNPTSDFINIMTENLSEYLINIYNLNGKLIKSTKNNNQDSIVIDVSDLKAGTYVINIVNTNVHSFKFIKIEN